MAVAVGLEPMVHGTKTRGYFYQDTQNPLE